MLTKIVFFAMLMPAIFVRELRPMFSAAWQKTVRLDSQPTPVTGYCSYRRHFDSFYFARAWLQKK
jgi:hypothetical protein